MHSEQEKTSQRDGKGAQSSDEVSEVCADSDLAEMKEKSNESNALDNVEKVSSTLGHKVVLSDGECSMTEITLGNTDVTVESNGGETEGKPAQPPAEDASCLEDDVSRKSDTEPEQNPDRPENQESPAVGPDAKTNDDSVVISSAITSGNTTVSKKKKRKKKKVQSPAISSQGESDNVGVTSSTLLGHRSPSIGSIDSLQELPSQLTSIPQSPRYSALSSSSSTSAFDFHGTASLTVGDSPTGKSSPGSFLSVDHESFSGQTDSTSLDRRSSLPMSGSHPSVLQDETTGSRSPHMSPSLKRSSSIDTASPTFRRPATPEGSPSLKRSSTFGSFSSFRRPSVGGSSPTLGRSPVSVDSKSLQGSPTGSPTSRRTSTPVDSISLSSSSPTQSVSQIGSATSELTSSGQTVTSSSSEPSSPLPSPSSSPTHHLTSAISMVRYMGVPYHTGSSSPQSSSSPKIHMPSLSEVKESISSKLSKTKAFLQNSGILTNKTPELIGVRPKDSHQGEMSSEVSRASEDTPSEESTLINYSALIEATQIARQDLAEIPILMDVYKIKVILAKWLRYLDDVQQEIDHCRKSLPETECSELTNELYKVQPRCKADIQFLATMCVDLEVFAASQEVGEKVMKGADEDDEDVAITTPTSSADENTGYQMEDNGSTSLLETCVSSSTPPQVTMETGYLQDLSLSNITSAGTDILLEASAFSEMTEADVAFHDSNQYLARDGITASFVHKYSYWLDLERVRKILSFWKGPRHQTWLTVVTKAQEIAESMEQPSWIGETDFNKVKTHLGTEIPFLHLCSHMNRLYKTDPDLAVKFCVDQYPTIAPWEVSILCSQGDDCRPLFMSYVKQLLESRKRETVIAGLCSDSWVKGHLVDCLLSQDAPEDPTKLACQCGMPRPGSYKFTWINTEIIDAIITSTSTPEHKEKLLSTFEKFRYWDGYVTLGCHVLPKTTWLEYLVQMADIDLLENAIRDPAKVNFTIDGWMLLLKLFNQFYQCKVDKTWTYYCLQCRKTVEPYVCDPPSPPTLAWGSLAELLLKSTNASTALELLQSVDIPHNALPGEFYNACILSSVIQRHQRDLANCMLEKIDSYLWSKRVNVVHSSVLNHALTEMKQLAPFTGPERDTNVYLQRPLCKQTLETLDVSLEDADTHIGVLVQIDSECHLCGLLLTRLDLHMDCSVIVGRCGHAFHKRCLPSKACPVCYASSH
ncbi:BLOC-2 complex member HPS5-like [Ptychodera flava]|uniref:BLOC-2 complex member HPS5-like n=1 Tax=Ptychodera flava TaxID=63121 RepID=UPI00396A375E